jgi:hypothetical protein
MVARQASDWCDRLVSTLIAAGHANVADIDDLSPANTATISAALRQTTDLVCYFGHGDDTSWLVHGVRTIDGASIVVRSGVAVVSVACNTGRRFGPDAVVAGVVSWLGFTIKIPVVSTYKTRDPFGDAIIEGLNVLASGYSMQRARDALYDALDDLAIDFDTGGPLSGHTAAWLGHFGAMCLRDHLVIHGSSSHAPL